MPTTYERNIAGENYVTRSRFGPVGRDLGRRTVLVNLDGRRRAPVGQGRAQDEWFEGYPGGGLKRSHHSDVVTRGGNLVGVISADAKRPGSKTSYAASVHEGSETHPILPRRKKWLRWPGPSGDVFRKGVIHPGTRKPQPWLRQSLEAARG